MGRWIVAVGLVLVAVGTALHFAPWLLNWFGRLPGDIRIETERTKVFIPITTMVLLSLIITVVINLCSRR